MRSVTRLFHHHPSTTTSGGGGRRTTNHHHHLGAFFSSTSIPSNNKEDTTTSTTTTTTTHHHHDVLIVGGGVVGTALAQQLERTCPGLHVGILEQREPNNPSSDDIPHPRSYALSPKSLSLLGLDGTNTNAATASGVKPSTPPPPPALGSYTEMQVWEANSPAMLVFTADDLPNSTQQQQQQQDEEMCLGACVEHDPLVHYLWNSLDTTTKYVGHDLVQLDHTGTGSLVKLQSTKPSSENDDDDDDQESSTTTFSANLIVGADGANSWVRRQQANVLDWKGQPYQDRMALTFTVELDRPMIPRRAYQRFLRSGPIALLPTHSPHHAVIVWSTTTEEAQRWKQQQEQHDGSSPQEQLVAHINALLQQGPEALPKLVENLVDDGGPSPVKNVLYGMERVLDSLQYGLGMKHFNDFPERSFMTPPKATAVVSPQFTFPLSRYQASHFGVGRIALVGDAAHTVHPMAGQGLNLGLKDVNALVETIAKSYNSGMDVATFVSTDYESSRQWEVTATVQGIHTLHEIFGRSEGAVMHAKSLGMQAVQHIGPIRRQLASIAAGLYP